MKSGEVRGRALRGFRPISAPVAALGAALLVSVPADGGLGPSLLVKTIAPTNGQVVTAKVKWKVRVRGGRATRIEFTIDGDRKWMDRNTPYMRYLDPATIERGRHVLRATAVSGTGRRASSTVSIIADPPAVYWGAYMDGNNTYGSSYGDAPWDDKTWRLFESHAGKSVSIVHWGTSLPPWQRSFNYFLSTHRKILLRGDLELVGMSSGSVPLRDIAAGKHDSSLRTWAQQAAAWGRPLFLRWNWEMNGQWFSWGTTATNQNTPSDYINSWRRFHDIANAAGATNISWVWCPNVDPYDNYTPFEQLYPGDVYVDWTCLDGYNGGGAGWTTFSSLFASGYDRLLQLAPTKPIMIAETSSTESRGSKSSWITDTLVTQLPENFPRIKAFVWFNWRFYEKGKWLDWQIESSSSAQAAFAAALSSPYYVGGGGLGKLPVRSKIEPLPAFGRGPVEVAGARD